MKIEQEWLKKQYEESDPYVNGILKVAEKVLDLMEALGDREIDADALIHQANTETKEGITGNMAAYVAMIATKCHSRGKEFQKSWNKHWGNEEANGVINPAVIEI